MPKKAPTPSRRGLDQLVRSAHTSARTQHPEPTKEQEHARTNHLIMIVALVGIVAIFALVAAFISTNQQGAAIAVHDLSSPTSFSDPAASTDSANIGVCFDEFDKCMKIDCYVGEYNPTPVDPEECCQIGLEDCVHKKVLGMER